MNMQVSRAPETSRRQPCQEPWASPPAPPHPGSTARLDDLPNDLSLGVVDLKTGVVTHVRSPLINPRDRPRSAYRRLA